MNSAKPKSTMHRGSSVGRGWPNATLINFHESPASDSSVPAAWCYTDRLSYYPGDIVRIHTSTTLDQYDLTIYRDGLKKVELHSIKQAKGDHHPTPPDCSVIGCNWPVAFEFAIPEATQSGGYILRIEASNDNNERIEHHFPFIIKARTPTSQDALLLIACTATWVAYNDWGGSNYYEGICGPDKDQASPVVSTQRPFSRGFAWLPEGAPRIPYRQPLKLGAVPRYIHSEWAYANGFSKKYASAGWASYERHFVKWAEQNGYTVDVATQHDIHFEPDILKRYKCAVLVGHDEYWSWEMRDAIDDYVDSGGYIARFAGNFTWQVRVTPEGNQQICYKAAAEHADPVRLGKQMYLLTTAWDDRSIGRPGTYTFGLKGTVGIYAGWGACVPRGPGGFTVYRPDHWAFAGTDLYYGDLLGAESKIFGYEVDGCDYTFRNGLPYATGSDGAPDNLEILAMGLATTFEADHNIPGAVPFISDHDLKLIAYQHERKTDEVTLERYRRGSGMIAYFERGKGAVLNAASCEWVAGLIDNDPFVEKTTKNIIDRFVAAAN